MFDVFDFRCAFFIDVDGDGQINYDEFVKVNLFSFSFCSVLVGWFVFFLLTVGGFLFDR